MMANDFVSHQPRTNQLTWKLANKRWKDDLDNPIYNQLQHMGIIEIMDYVNQRTGYLDAFKSIGTKKLGTKAREEDLLACIFGNCSNYGLHHMSSISDRAIGVLRAVNDGYIRPETTSNANDVIQIRWQNFLSLNITQSMSPPLLVVLMVKSMPVVSIHSKLDFQQNISVHLRRILANQPFPTALINKGLKAHIGLFAEMGTKPRFQRPGFLRQ